MRLHHFTGPENLFLISLRGLEPDIKEYNAWQTLGQQVVWLTRQETNRATAAEVEHWRQFWKEDNECAYPRNRVPRCLAPTPILTKQSALRSVSRSITKSW